MTKWGMREGGGFDKETYLQGPPPGDAWKAEVRIQVVAGVRGGEVSL